MCDVNRESQTKQDSGQVCDQPLEWFKCPRLILATNNNAGHATDQWGYNKNSGQCEKFNFVCGDPTNTLSNVNRFDAKDVCMAYCVTRGSLLPPDLPAAARNNNVID
jgi:hypothetical protein